VRTHPVKVFEVLVHHQPSLPYLVGKDTQDLHYSFLFLHCQGNQILINKTDEQQDPARKAILTLPSAPSGGRTTSRVGFLSKSGMLKAVRD
jgi:hypothetical protein